MVTMRYGAIPGLSPRVSRLILGSVSLRDDNMALTTAMLDRYAEAGGNAVDTAYQYGEGASERGIGNWMRASGRRADMIVITKGCHHLADLKRRVNPTVIEQEMGESLARFDCGPIDLYLLHRDDPEAPVGPIVDALDAAVRGGRIRSSGGSNWSTARLEAALEYARASGKHGFVASSPNLALAVAYGTMWHEALSIAGDVAARAWYTRRQFPLLAWSSGASGFFTGRFAPGRVDDANVQRVYDRPDNWERLRRAQELARRRGVTPQQVALAWVLHQPFPTFALIGPRSVAELDDSLGALEVELSDGEAAWLNLEGES